VGHSTFCNNFSQHFTSISCSTDCQLFVDPLTEVLGCCDGVVEKHQ